MNAKKELCSILQDLQQEGVVITCAYIYGDLGYDEEGNYIPSFKHILKTPYTQEDLDKFFDELDFDYDSGYGLQQLFGTVWCSNGYWLERGEYDGSEWWEVRNYPEIPEELKKRN